MGIRVREREREREREIENGPGGEVGYWSGRRVVITRV